jgi:hypothetical protein
LLSATRRSCSRFSRYTNPLALTCCGSGNCSTLGDKCEQDIAVASRGKPEHHRAAWPDLIRSYFGGVVNPLSDERILGNLEHAALNEHHAWSRNKQKLREDALAAVCSKRPPWLTRL